MLANRETVGWPNMGGRSGREGNIEERGRERERGGGEWKTTWGETAVSSK